MLAIITILVINSIVFASEYYCKFTGVRTGGQRLYSVCPFHTDQTVRDRLYPGDREHRHRRGQYSLYLETGSAGSDCYCILYGRRAAVPEKGSAAVVRICTKEVEIPNLLLYSINKENFLYAALG